MMMPNAMSPTNRKKTVSAASLPLNCFGGGGGRLRTGPPYVGRLGIVMRIGGSGGIVNASLATDPTRDRLV